MNIKVKCDTQLVGYNVNLIKLVSTKPSTGELIEVLNKATNNTEFLSITSIRHRTNSNDVPYLELELSKPPHTTEIRQYKKRRNK